VQPPSIYPPDDFSQSQIDTTYPYLYHNGLYDDESQLEVLSVQTPLPFTPFHQQNAEDMVDPLYAHPYLRSTPNPSLQTDNHFDNFEIPNAAPLSLDFRDTTSDFFTVSSTSNSNHHLHPNMLTSNQSPTSYFEDSDFCPSSQLSYVINLNYPSFKVDVGGLSRFFLFELLAAVFTLQAVPSTPRHTTNAANLPPKMRETEVKNVL
jgi:hypothetical protein